ncbi:MAG: glycosyltransferase family 39 protein [Chloroflexota bacterium]|nr:glycosyltransferase family 39 protein [Chloroflexota bacterium]
MPDWIAQTLAATPAFLALIVGVGIPYALLVTPRADWRRGAQIAAVALLIALALLTAWMFVLGMIGALRLEATVAGMIVIAIIGAALAWRKARAALNAPPAFQRATSTRLASDEWLIVVLIAAALIVRWLVIAWWSFTAYDALWVYGYQGRLYGLLGQIPNTIGYYPPFMALQYTFGQLIVGGIDDHAARAGLILLHAGSILAVYVLGSRLFERRTGIVAAGLWALYPHVGEWSRAGDLEIALAFAFALASAFWLLAWENNLTPRLPLHTRAGQNDRRRYAVLAGLMLGIGMWIKPTMGAFALGVALMLIIDLLRVRFDWRAWRPRLESALIMLLAALPLGGVWYVRNLLLGHNLVDFPPDYWQSLAARSGVEFGWVLLALIVGLAYIYLERRMSRPRGVFVLIGVALIAFGVAPTILTPARIGLFEWMALTVGSVAFVWSARGLWARLDVGTRADAAKIGWAWTLGLPYFVVWFVAYSYHYRLSFAVVPLLLLPTALILSHWLRPPRRSAVRALYLSVIALIGLPGVVSAVYDPFIGSDYLWSDAYPDDASKYRSGNGALMNVVDGLEAWIEAHPGERLHVVAPGVDRLPFFFPLHDIRTTDAPTRLDDLAGVPYFVYGYPETRGEYENVPYLSNQVLGALARTDISRRAWGLDDGIFRYDVYELNLANRYNASTPNGVAVDEVVFGGFARYRGYDIAGLDFWAGRRLIFKLYWESIAPAPDDYSIMVHLRDADDNLITAWDAPAAQGEHGYYSTLMWQPGEVVIDERGLRLPDGVLPVGTGYRLIIGMYNAATGARVPITVNGVETDEYQIENRIAILESAP